MTVKVKIVAVYYMGNKGISVDFQMGRNVLTNCFPATRINPPVVGETWLAGGNGRLIMREVP